MQPEFKCLFCDELLTEATASREHIIPNALGGHLLTSKATCVKCNSKAGGSIDGHLLKFLGPLAGLFDVPRSRGEHPALVLKEETTGNNFEWPVTGNPHKADNLKVRRDGENLTVELTANTEEEARTILRKKGIERVQDLQFQVMDEGPPSISLPQLSYKDEQVLRAVAKIALCFARHHGVHVRGTSTAAQFARGEPVRVIPVGTPLTDVVSIQPLPSNPVHHAVCVFKPVGSKSLFAYVTLFHAFEFVVVLDEDSEVVEINRVHLWNVISGRTEPVRSEWIVTEQQVHEWLTMRLFSGERMLQRAAPLKYWLPNNRELIWTQRAVLTAFDDFIAMRERGLPHPEALAKAKTTADRVLSKYGLAIERLDFSPT